MKAGSMLDYEVDSEKSRDMRPGVNEQTVEWLEHEHLALVVQIEAQKLLDQTGSPEFANQAIDDAASYWSEELENQREEFAHGYGFKSYVAMLQCSMAISSDRRKNWCVTPVGEGHWILWNDEDLVAEAGFRPLL